MSVVGSSGTVSFQFGVTGHQLVIDAMNMIDQAKTKLIAGMEQMRTSLGTAVATGLPQELQKIGEQSDIAGTKTQTFTQRMSGFQGNLLTAATSVGTFTASIFGIDAAMDNLTRSELSLEQARVRQDRMQVTLQAQEQKLSELRNSGTASAADIAVQEERVNTTRQQVEVQTERVSFMQQNLNEDYAQFASQILPQVITATLSGVTAMTSLVTLIGKSDTAVKLLNTGWDKFKGMLEGVLPVMTQTSGAVTTTTSTLGLLGKSLALSGLTVGSLVIGMTLFANNVGGAREAVNNWGIELGKLNPHLQAILKDLGQLGDIITETFNPKTRFTMQWIDEALNVIRTRAITSFSELRDEIGQLAPAVDTADAAFLRLQSGVASTGVLLLDLQTQTDALLKTFAPMVDKGADVTLIFEDYNKDLQQLLELFANVPEMAGQIETVKKALADIQLDKFINVDEFKNLLVKTIPSFIQQGADVIHQELVRLTQTSAEAFQSLVNEIDTKIAPAFATSMGELRRLMEQGIGGEGDPLGKVMAFTGVEQSIDKIVAAVKPLFVEMKTGMDVTEQFSEMAMPKMIDAMGLLGGMTKENKEQVVEWAKAILQSGKAPDALRLFLEGLINTFGDAEDKSVAFAASLSEEEKEYIALAKAVYNKNISTQEELDQSKPLLESAKARIDAARDEFDAARENAIQYGVSAEALNAFSVETDYSAESIKQKTLQVVELTNSQIQWNEINDNSIDSLIRLEEATQAGIVAFKDLYEEFVLGEKQSQAFGEALSSHVMEVLKKSPEFIKEAADAFKSLMPNLFGSLEEFQGKITPFDKQSIKDYKEELKDLDVPKSLRDLYISSAKVWQDKDEIIQEGEALFAGMAGSLVHNFENIDVGDVTTFLDEIGGRLTELEAEGVGTEFTGNIRNLIEHIKNSSDPVQELLTHFDALKGAMDPSSIDVVATSMKLFGDNANSIVQNAILGDLTKETNLFQQAVNKLGQEDLQKLASDVGAYMTGIRGQITGANPKTKFSEKELKDIEDARQIEKATTIALNKQKEESTAMATAWQTAQTAITASTAAITTSVTTMKDMIKAINAELNADVLVSQTAWSTFSTSVATYSTSMSTNFGSAQQTMNQSMLLMIEGVQNTDAAWLLFKDNLVTYTGLMTTGVTTYGDTSVQKLAALDAQSVTSDKAMSKFQTNWAVYMMVMEDQVNTWSEATVKAFKAVEDGAGTAETAVKGLADAIAALKDKTVTIKVDVQESSTSSQQYGGVKLLTHPQYVFGGEGHKPEIHMTFPLDQMSQSHATDAFKLPFNIGDITAPKIAPSFMGSGSPPTVIPSNLVSNLRVNANLTIDLGNEIKKRVREEINAIAVTRLDRMPF